MPITKDGGFILDENWLIDELLRIAKEAYDKANKSVKQEDEEIKKPNA